MKKTFFLCLCIAQISVAFAEAPTLYFQTTDNATMVCNTPENALIANAISHGYDFGATVAHQDWLRKQTEKKTCAAVAPGQRFITSPAKAVYMRSINDVRWVVQMLPPSDISRPVGWVPIQHIDFIPIPTL